jgi:ribosome recycling factor
VRVGRATPSLVENIEVEAYGGKMKMIEVGTISVPDAQMIVIAPWDKGLIKEIDSAIRNAGMGLNPVPDSISVKVPVPPLTEERRKEFTKLVSEKAETAKNVIRNVRQDAMKDIDKKFSEKTITEDEKFTHKEEVEKVVKEFISKIEELSESKKKDLMSV